MESIANLKDSIARGDGTAHTIVESSVNAAESLNDSLNAFLQIDREGAMQRADEIDKSPSKYTLPLAGIPIAIKDNICVRGMQASCGSRILGPYHPPYNATAIERLIKAGGVIIGNLFLEMGQVCLLLFAVRALHLSPGRIGVLLSLGSGGLLFGALVAERISTQPRQRARGDRRGDPITRATDSHGHPRCAVLPRSRLLVLGERPSCSSQ